MTIFVAIVDRVGLLPFFLRYYSKQGITRFVYILFNGDKNPCYPELSAMSQGYTWEMRPFEGDQGRYQPQYEVCPINLAKEEFVKPDEWYAVADLDEFHHYGVAFPQVVEEAKRRGFQCIWSMLVDRFGPGASSLPLRQDLTLDEQFPLCSHITEWSGGNPYKVGLQVGEFEIYCGHHCARDWGYRRGKTHHFRWHGQYRNYLAERLREQEQINDFWVGEHYRLLAILDTPNFLDCVEAETHSAVPIGV